MKTQLIVNRTNDWFLLVDNDLDVYLLCIEILEKLNSRRQLGLSANLIKLTNIILKRISNEAVTAISSSITVLLSRQLIKIHAESEINKTYHISELGLTALERFREEFSYEN